MSKVTSLWGLVFLCACGTGSRPSSLAQDTFPTDPIPDEVANQVIGHYAMLINYASRQKLPIVGSVSTLGQLFKVADIQRDGDGLRIIEKSCRLKFEGGHNLGLTFSDASIQGSPVMEGRFMATQDTPDGQIRFARETLTQVLGAHLADPLLDPLPGSKDDSRVFDMDGDGKPGATVDARAFILRGSLNYLLRSTNRYEGIADGLGVLQGLIKDKTEGVVLDVSNFFLRPAIGKFEFIPDADPSKSKVILVKIPASLDCSTVDWDIFGAFTGD